MKYILCGLLFVSHFLYSQTPLPPINAHVIWEINVTTQLSSYSDFFSYGAMYERCGHTYVAVIRNDAEEVLYLRQTEDQAFYLLDLDDCDAERLLYDYSVNDEVHIPIQTELNFPDSFQLVPTSITGNFTDAILGNEVKGVNYAYQSGPFTFQATSFWFRGVGDYIHPFYPIYNSFDPGAEIIYRLQSLHVNSMAWYCASPTACIANNIIYVDRDVTTGNQDGSTWSNAYASLSNALDAAEFGDMLWVADGTYTLPMNGDRLASFVLRDGVSVYGGFNGTETYFNERDPSLNITILSGDIGVVDDASDNTFHIVRLQDVNQHVVLDGVHLEAGNSVGGNMDFPFSQNGGAILIHSALPGIDTANIVINNCNFLHDHAKQGGSIAFNSTYNLPTRLCITNSIFSDNRADNGGGAIYIPSLNNKITCRIESSVFQDNEANFGSGGAIYDNNNVTDWWVSRSEFTNNRMNFGDGGAIALWNLSSERKVHFSATDFINNRSSTDGGAISYFHQGGNAGLDAVFESCKFLENRGQTGAGGGISIASFETFALQMAMNRCELTDNYSANRGGALHILSDGAGQDGTISINQSTFSRNRVVSNIGGAISVSIRTPNDQVITNKKYEVDIKNSIFVRNRGAYSQGNATFETAILGSFSNCTFYKNGLLPLSKNYSTDFNDSTYTNQVDLTNCILWEEGIPIEQLLYNGNPANYNTNNYRLDHCLLSTDDCNISGGEETCYENLNYFNTYPLFRDTANNDFRLLGCSPFINAGVNYEAAPEDLAGNDRVQEGVIDLGAYETGSYQSILDRFTNRLDCFGDSTGQVEISSFNAMPPIEYALFDNTNSDLLSTNSNGLFEDLRAGTYRLISTDSIGCRDTINLAIEQPDPLSLYVTTSDFFSTAEAGSISIDSITGGTQPYHFFFEGELTSVFPIEELNAGAYLLSVEDSLGCTQDTLIEIRLIDGVNEIQDISAAISVTPNPANASSRISIGIQSPFSFPSEIFVTIIDASGRNIYHDRLPSNQHHFQVDAPKQEGSYFVMVRMLHDDSELLGIQKLIVVEQ